MALPYYTLYPSDFETDEKIRLMEDDELGLFMRCMNHAWINDGLPQDPEEIRRALRDSPDSFQRKWARVGECFPVAEDGRRRNSRQEKERAKATGKVERAKAANSARRSAVHNVDVPQCITSTFRDKERGTRAYSSDSDSKNQETTKLREFPKAAPVPADSDPAPCDSVSMWEEAGFQSHVDAGDWWNALVVKHPNRNGCALAESSWLERVRAGKFSRALFDAWYPQQIPKWKKYPQYPNLQRIMQDGEYMLPVPTQAAVNYNDPKRYELGD